MKEQHLKDLMLRAHNKKLGLGALLIQASLLNKAFDLKNSANILLCREILFRLEQRSWASSEKISKGEIFAIKSAIQTEGLKLLSNIESTSKEMNALGLRFEQSQAISFGTALFSAQHSHGLEPWGGQQLKAASLQICQLTKQQGGS